MWLKPFLAISTGNVCLSRLRKIEWSNRSDATDWSTEHSLISLANSPQTDSHETLSTYCLWIIIFSMRKSSYSVSRKSSFCIASVELQQNLRILKRYTTAHPGVCTIDLLQHSSGTVMNVNNCLVGVCGQIVSVITTDQVYMDPSLSLVRRSIRPSWGERSTTHAISQLWSRCLLLCWPASSLVSSMPLPACKNHNYKIVAQKRQTDRETSFNKRSFCICCSDVQINECRAVNHGFRFSKR